MSEQPTLELNIASRGRRPPGPTLFLPSFAEPEAHPDLDGIVRRLGELAAGAPLSFCAGAATYPGWDTLPSVTVYGGGHWLATVYLPGVTAPTALEALALACGVPLEDAA